jgi:hypothetical protein
MQASTRPDTDNTLDFDSAAASVLHRDQQATATQIRNNVLWSVGTNADQAARNIQLAKYTRAPVSAVQADPVEAQRQAAMQQMDAGRIASEFPHLAKYLTDPDNTSQSHDDIPQLAAVEQTAKALPSVPPTQQAPSFDEPHFSALPPVTPTIRDRLTNWWASVVGGPTADEQRRQQGAAEANAILVAREANPALVPPADATPAQIKALNDQAWEASRQAVGGMSPAAQIAAQRFLTAASLGIAAPTVPAQPHDWQQSTAGAAGSLGGFIAGPANAASGLLSKIPGMVKLAPVTGEAWATQFAKTVVQHAVTLALANTVQEAGHAVLDTHSAGEAAADIGQAAKSGAETGALFGGASKLLPDSTIPQWVLRAVGVSAAQDALDGTSMFDDRPLEDKLFSYGMNALFTAHGGGRSDGNWFTSNPEVQERFANIEKASDAIRAGQSFAEMSAAASQSKTRERDASGFKTLLANMSDEDQVKEVYVKASEFENALQQSGVTPDQLLKTLPDVVDQMHEARQTNGDLRIPVGDYMAHVAGTDMDRALQPHLKAYPDAMTFAEGQAYYEQQKAGMAEQAAKLVQDQGKQEAAQQQAQDIHDNVLGQLEAVGRFRPEVNKAYASLVRDFYTAQAERNGMTPAEMYERYPLKVGGEAFGGLEQGARGNYSPDTHTIGLFKDADLSTFLHESGHFFLEVTHDLANRPDVPAQLLADRDTLLKWQGINSPEAWNSMTLDQKREAHEQFARGFEAYLMEGKAPSMEMQGVFSRFRSWLVNIYKSLTSLRVELTPEVRQVMDRMLASDEAIKQAEQTRGYLAMDKVPEGTDPALLHEYQALGAQATQDAQAEMTARSMRDMRWLSNAKGKAVRDLQRQADTQRDVIREEVTKEVMDTPVRQAEAYLKRPNNTDPVPLAEQKAWENERAQALADFTDKVKAELFEANPDATGIKKGQLLAKNKRAVANEAERRTLEWEKENPRPTKAKTEPYPDFIAEMFGFADGKALKAAIKEAGPLKDQIDALTDQRMLERHGDLTDPVSIERAAEAAIHNDARARFMATGLKMLSKSPMPARQLAKAAKEAADTAIAAKQVKDLRPAQYSAAEARANKDVIKLAPKDPAGAVQAQRAALLNNRLFKSASDAVSDVQKGLDYFKKFSKDSIRGKIDVDIRDQIDDLLARFDLRKNPTDQPTRAQINLQNWVESQIAAGYSPAVSGDMLRPEVRMPYAEMTVEQFRGLVDSVKSLEHIGKERKTITINGERTLLDDYVKTRLVPKIAERGVNFTPDELLDKPEDRFTNPVALQLNKFQSWLRGVAAELKPQEFKRNQYDRHELLGPFGESLFDPVVNANYRKIDMLKGLSTDFEAMAKKLGRDWQDSLREKIDNKILLDPDKSEAAPVPMNFTRGKMIGLAIHVGNESNFDKLTKGWGWQGADVWKFLHDNMTAKDWQAVQAVWDLYEKHWPEVEAMNRRLGNTTPDKIQPRPFNTPFGEMRGGYAAITYDALRSRRGEKVASGEAINPSEGLFGRGYFRADSTTNGSLNARNDSYVDRVDLDFHGIPKKLNETIHDLAYRETLIDAHKIIEHPDFRKAFKSAYGPEAYRSMQDWIGNLANAQNLDSNTSKLGKFLQYTRTGMVINAIAFRATTVLKHGGSAGIKTLGYFAGGGEKYLASRMASMGTDYSNQISSAQEKFSEIRARLMQQDRDFRSLSHSLFEPEKVIDQAERFGHAAVAWSDMMTAVPTAWAAYDRAITEGIPESQGGTGKPMTEAQAVAYANKIVREAHGSQIEASRSMVMNNSNEAIRMFTTLYGFMNTTYGQMLDGADKLRTEGISNPAVFARTFMAIIVPALWAGYLTHGTPKDKTVEGWAEWAGKAVAGEVAGAVPFVRDAVAMFEGYKNAGLVGAENWIGTMVQAAKDIASGNGKPVRDIANAIGMGLHIPGMGQLGTSAQYAADVASGKEHPQDTTEMVKGVVTGHGDHH